MAHKSASFKAGFSSSTSSIDDAFSKPVVRRRFQNTIAQHNLSETTDDTVLPSVSDDSSSPHNRAQVFSPPISIPETLSDGNADTNLSSSDSESDIPASSQNSTGSLSRKLESSKITTEQPIREKKSRPYEFEEDDGVAQPNFKKLKEEPQGIVGAKFIPKKDKKPVYNHRWNSDDAEEDEDDIPPPRQSSSSSKSDSFAFDERKPIQPVLSAQPRRPIYCRQPKPSSSSSSSSSSSAAYLRMKSRVKNVKDPNEILESGEYDDFKQDIVYILSTLRNKSSAVNVKCLSAISLARKCVIPEFRQFIKSEGMGSSVFRALADAPENEIFALTASTVIYLLSRDFNAVKIDFPSLKLISQLLRVETLGEECDERERMLNMVWDVFNTYIEKQEVGGRKVTFEMKKENICASSLVLEAMVFISTRCSNDEAFKTELLNLGILQWIVAKVEAMVNKLENDDEDETAAVMTLDRCFRILENCSMLHKKNQAFLISHRGSTLINMLAKCLRLMHEKAVKISEDRAEKLMSVLALMARVLINLSHENELCCSKLGQIDGFLPACLMSFTYLAPKYAGDDKKFDIYVMMSSLLTNLVERCNVNRKKLIGINVKLFVHHESQAKTIDEDLDKELAFEECEGEENEDDGSSDDEDGAKKDGRLDRNKMDDMNDDDMVNAVQQVMTKAHAHMEDSIIASYLALLIGCLLQQNEEHVDEVRKELPDGSFAKMLEQLQRFLDFMKVTLEKKGGNAGCRAIEKIIDLLERLE
ncbi:unnamed protein product [Caenorhabditis bovis]|uniref:WAPL domain-containing protein n=1 Tax=Caenorhabditis bovis TaxID=2654633 RepID=A0A8S1F021_9PELO|nr:unnamed protein product [Caenorhabditis bovis]